jgi:hypothetical protein
MDLIIFVKLTCRFLKLILFLLSTLEFKCEKNPRRECKLNWLSRNINIFANELIINLDLSMFTLDKIF